MKVTHFGPGGFPWAHVSNFGGVNNIISLGSNTNTEPPLSALNYVQRITANSSNVLLNPIVNFAGGSNIILTLDQGPFPTQAYPSNTIRIHSTASGGGGGGSGTLTTIEEVDGSPTDSAVTKLVFPNGTLSIVSHVATYTPTSSGGGAVVLLEQHSASASGSLDFSSWYSSTYDDYFFELLNLVPATNNVDFFVRYGNGSADSGANYSNATFAWSSGGTAVTGAAGTSALKLRNVAEIDSNTNGGVTGTLKVWYPGSTGTFRRSFLSAGYLNGDPVNAETVCEYTGSGGSIVNFASFLFSSGNITSGTVRCYGIVKT